MIRGRPCHEHCCQYLPEATASPPQPSGNRKAHCSPQERLRIILSWRPRSRVGQSRADRSALSSIPQRGRTLAGREPRESSLKQPHRNIDTKPGKCGRRQGYVAQEDTLGLRTTVSFRLRTRFCCSVSLGLPLPHPPTKVRWSDVPPTRSS